MTIQRIITNGGSYDSELCAPNPRDNGSELRLNLRIRLRQNNPAGSAATGSVLDSGHRYAIARWTATEWADYGRRYEEICESVWNAGFYLLPPASLPQVLQQELTSTGAGASTQSPFIVCTLDIQITTQAAGSHASIGCYRLADSETQLFRSYVQPSSGRDSGSMTSQDIFVEPYFDVSDFVPFNCIAHEVGHILGVNHPVCAGNAQMCYGASGSPEYRSVMGLGTQITRNEARPWIRRIALHTGVHHGWTFTTTRPHQRSLDELMGAPVP